MTSKERAPAKHVAGALEEDLAEDSRQDGIDNLGISGGLLGGTKDVPTSLSLINKRAIGTEVSTQGISQRDRDSNENRPECWNGIGALLRDAQSPTRGRDVQLPCKRRNCDVCGPEKQARKLSRIMRDFADDKMHAIEVEDGDEWEALHKSIERAGALYHRVPVPDGKVVILTNADVGSIVPDPEEFTRHVIAAQPCDPSNQRRMTSSRKWKGAGDSSSPRWAREGTSKLAQSERVVVYEEAGCEPTPVDEEFTSPEVVSAYDIRLPLGGSPEMDQLAKKLQLKRDETVEFDENGWPVSP